MSWMPMLYKTYQNVMSGDTENLMPPLYPIAHTTQNAEVEVSLDVFGNWIGSAVVEENSKTLIPCTESSASRTSHATPHPLCDKLQYVAGDYTAFGGTKGEQSHIDYMNALKAWCNSAYGGEKIQAIYTYLQKNCLIRDLVNAGTLVCGEDEKLLLKWTGDKAETPKIFKKIVGIQSDAFVRFRVSGGTSNETAVWQDKQLQEDFIRYYASTQNEKALCYVTGEMTACTDNHPSKIRNTGDKAKLISSTDTCGFKFKGRFTNAQQAVSVGYEVSQKAHNALKWLVEKQGKRFGGKVFLLWGTHNEKTPDPTADGFDFYEDAAVPINTDESIARRFNLAAAGYKAELSAHTELILMGLDSATVGRLAISFYREYQGADANELIDRIALWHKTAAWSHRFHFKDGKVIPFYGAPAPRDIATVAYGTEQGNFIKAEDAIIAQTVERILPCICDGAKIPRDIVNAVIKKAFFPQNYSSVYNWYKVLSIACSLVKKYRFDYFNEEEWSVIPNMESMDINYNCGRLLAVADAIESWALSADNEKRATTAIRYFTRFSQYPCETWGIITNRLNIYKQKLGGRAKKYTDMIAEISARIDSNEFAKLKNLDGRMALGFDSQRQYILSTIKKSKENEED